MDSVARHIRGVSLVLFAVFVLTSGGCGGIAYSHTIMQANKALAQAKVNNAEEYAPYEYTYAVQHANKAKQEVAHADYQLAYECAKVAVEYAIKAKDIARKLKMEAGRD
jgi:hypothetical protein